MQSTAAHTTRLVKKGVLRAVLLLGSLAHLFLIWWEESNGTMVGLTHTAKPEKTLLIL